MINTETKRKSFLLAVVVVPFMAILVSLVLHSPATSATAATGQGSHSLVAANITSHNPFVETTKLSSLGVSANNYVRPLTFFAADASCDPTNFFGLVPWYKYLSMKPDPDTGHCEIAESPDEGNVLTSKSFFVLIIIAIVEDLLRIAGLVAIIFVIVAGFKFITSSGEPEQAVSAKKTMIFALAGMAIALMAVVFVSYMGHSLGV